MTNRTSLAPAKKIEWVKDPFSKKSGTALLWILAHQQYQRSFSINELGKTLNLSPGTVHRTLAVLAYEGIFSTSGLRTAKQYSLNNTKEHLKQWLQSYKVLQRTKKLQATSSDPSLLTKLNLLDLGIVPALHTAARKTFHVGVVNIRSFEGYVLNWKKISSIASKLSLVEQDRGYDVLLIEPYYHHFVSLYFENYNKPDWNSAYEILTFLDLYHFPIRGREQAEALFRKSSALKSICSWKEIEESVE